MQKGGDEVVFKGRRQTYKRSQTLAFLPLPLQRGTARDDIVPAAPSPSASSSSSCSSSAFTSAGRRCSVRDRSSLSSRASIPGCLPMHDKRQSLSGGNVSAEMDAALRTHYAPRGASGVVGNVLHRYSHSMVPDNYHDIIVGASFALDSGGPAGGSGGSGGSAPVVGGRRHGSSSSSSSSCNPGRTTIIGGSGAGVQHTKRLGRTPSSPSVLLSKVKERIREKVFETSAEWPHMAAIVQERRQRAADAFEARMSLKRMHMMASVGDQDHPSDHQLQQLQQQQQHRMRRVRIRSDPAQHRRTSSSGSSCSYSGFSGGSGSGAAVAGTSSGSFDIEGARVAFRRRSISDDTYNQQRRTSSSGSSRSFDRGGIVCSDDDLRAIVYEHRLRRSPVPLKHQETTVTSGTMDIDEEEVAADSAVFTESSANIFLPEVPAFDSLVAMPGDGGRSSPGGQEKAAAASVSASASSTASAPHSISPDSRSQDGKNRDAFCSLPKTITEDERDREAEGGDDPGQGQGQGQGGGDLVLAAEDERSAVVPDIVFDEHGQTWDVYGAEFDPEILGQAIQSHLEKIMKRRISKRKDCKTIDANDESESLEQSQLYSNDLRAPDGREANDRALRFFLRYLCFLARSSEQSAQTT